ncbi:MAG: hypothetical protein JWP56_2800 [Aeromicrobium sp.]|jgi:hypothetical protein|nr:hypothetical protein [Aeromicrobium sp.]
MSDVVTIVVGPRTRLGRALVSAAVERGEPVVAVARHAEDAAALAGSGAEIVLASDHVEPHGRRVRVLVCALGPVHPTDPGTPVDPAADTSAVERDLAIVDRLLAAAPTATVVLVSTVIALAPGPDRRYYGGWKNVVERAVRELAHRHRAEVAVLYPGRLVADVSVTRPWHRLYTRYTRLARRVEEAAAAAPRSRVVGLDARLWLLVRGITIALGSVTGSAGVPSAAVAPLRDPRTTSEEITP